MKKIYITVIVMLLSVGIVYADNHTCTTEWIQQDGEKYKPPVKLILAGSLNRDREDKRIYANKYRSTKS